MAEQPGQNSECRRQIGAAHDIGHRFGERQPVLRIIKILQTAKISRNTPDVSQHSQEPIANSQKLSTDGDGACSACGWTS